MQILVMTQLEAEEGPPPAVPYAHISILGPGWRTALPDVPHRLATLFLECDDIRDEDAGGTPISEEQAREVVLFVTNLPEAVEVLVCQCRAGCSRSPATAAAVARILGMDEAPFFDNPNYAPNPLVYHKILMAALIERGGGTRSRR